MEKSRSQCDFSIVSKRSCALLCSHCISCCITSKDIVEERRAEIELFSFFI